MPGAARGCELVAGEGGGVSGRHDARVGGQRPVGRVGLGWEHVEADAGQVPGIQVAMAASASRRAPRAMLTSQAPGRMCQAGPLPLT